MLKTWTEEFLSVSISLLGVMKRERREARVRLRADCFFFQTVSKLDPKFIALHCQEVGGKNYEQSMKHVEYFVR
jgi:hypothetical protein